MVEYRCIKVISANFSKDKMGRIGYKYGKINQVTADYIFKMTEEAILDKVI